MKITRKHIDDEAVKRQLDTKQDGKDLLKMSLIWWLIFLILSLVTLLFNGINFSFLLLIFVCALLVRIGNLVAEVSVNIRTTIKQNDDIRLLLLANSSLDDD